MGRRARVLACAACAAALSSAAWAADDALARARQLYNDQQYEAAVNAAEQARLSPARADAADLVAARAYLERYRSSEASDDLTNARIRLRRLDPAKFEPRERVEYLVGLGEALLRRRVRRRRRRLRLGAARHRRHRDRSARTRPRLVGGRARPRCAAA